MQNQNPQRKINKAILQVFGLKHDEYISRSRKKIYVYARVVYTKIYIEENGNYYDSVRELSSMLNRDRTTIYYYISMQLEFNHELLSLYSETLKLI